MSRCVYNESVIVFQFSVFMRCMTFVLVLCHLSRNEQHCINQACQQLHWIMLICWWWLVQCCSVYVSSVFVWHKYDSKIYNGSHRLICYKRYPNVINSIFITIILNLYWQKKTHIDKILRFCWALTQTIFCDLNKFLFSLVLLSINWLSEKHT